MNRGLCLAAAGAGRVLPGRAPMRLWGIRRGDVTLSFTRL
jgi:hypothetical protein